MRKIILPTVFFLGLFFVMPRHTVRAGAIACKKCCYSAAKCAGYIIECSTVNPSITYYSCVNKNPEGLGDCRIGAGVCNYCNGNPDCEIACENGCSGEIGGGYYDYTHCPSGNVLSCGSSTEAQAQNKYGCFYKAYCNNYFFPSSSGAGCDADNPAKANCQWNCSCCPSGSYRTCTQGSQYDVTITIDLTNQSVEEREAAKISCAQWLGLSRRHVRSFLFPR